MPTVALVGTAHIHTPGFVDALVKRGFSVPFVYDHDIERARKTAEKVGGEATTDLAKALAGADAAVVCSETRLHEELVGPIVTAGLPLFVEKPLGFAADDAARMAEAIEGKGLAFSTGYFMRGSRELLWIKARVEDGWFGQVTRARASNCHSGALGGWFDGEWRWMADPKEAGCGGFGDLGTHVLDILMWIFGDVRAAVGARTMGTGRYEGCDEAGEALMVHENGVISTFAAGWDDIANPVSFLVSGTKGHAFILDGKLHAKGEGVDGQVDDLPEAPASGFTAFLDHLEGKPATLVGAREAAARSRVMGMIHAENFGA